ncbi:hypothetical protein Syun_028294 [Stephania yunnanensis]|uniref:Uncharacterized protein n=1 Tax=Stephania yunnanensis TaxID=152371 RepID=A0AAP0EPF5_9MAGN
MINPIPKQNGEERPFHMAQSKMGIYRGSDRGAHHWLSHTMMTRRNRGSRWCKWGGENETYSKADSFTLTRIRAIADIGDDQNFDFDDLEPPQLTSKLHLDFYTEIKDSNPFSDNVIQYMDAIVLQHIQDNGKEDKEPELRTVEIREDQILNLD